MVTPRTVVDPPLQGRRPLGLLDHVDFRETGDRRWLAGVQYMADCSGAETIALDVCGPSVTGGFADTGSRSMRGATAFTVYSEFTCSPVDFYDRANELAEAALRRNEGWQVENAFWTGTVTDNWAGQTATVYPHLAEDTQVTEESGGQTIVLQTAATVVVTGTGLDPRSGLGILESALGDCYGGVGMIHVPQKIVTHLHGQGLLIAVGDRWRTANGNWVVSGAGYQGTSPAGAAAGLESAWMYATSPVWGYRSDITVFPPRTNLDRSVNTVTARAARSYLLTWDCCHLAVQVDAATS